MAKKVLIVEDYEDTREFMKILLESYGYKVIEAADGIEAIDRVKQYHPDLILMDMSMPKMDGLEATLMIRKSLGHQPVIIALTANTMKGDREECLLAGMNDYISKPVKMDELIDKLQQWHSFLQHTGKKVSSTAEFSDVALRP